MSRFHSVRRITVISAIVVVLCLYTYGQEAEKTETNKKKPVATKIVEIGKVSDNVFNMKMAEFWKTYDPEVPLFVIFYGAEAEMNRWEGLFIKSKPQVPYHHAWITIVRGGKSLGRRTAVFWKVPRGADYPAP